MAKLSTGDIKRLSSDARKQIRHALRLLPDTTPAVPMAGEGGPLPSKYRNVRTTVDGITFASRREAQRYAELKLQLLAGEITDLQLQRPFSLDVSGVHICDYVADFVYRTKGVMVVEDAKGKRLEPFRLKKALMGAAWEIDVVEV